MTIIIDVPLVQRLIKSQFPRWADLPIKPVEFSGWDNRTFHLGPKMTVRIPSAEFYSQQAEKEQYWLPKLGPHLSFAIPTPLGLGLPSDDYPWHWSVYSWIEGQTVTSERINSMQDFAKDLAKFLVEFRSIDSTGGPVAGEHSFYRGGSLNYYDAQTKEAINKLANKLDVSLISSMWSEALANPWEKPPVWVHGDIAIGNLLVNQGRLSAVIDFGRLAIGDPACDLVITWTFLDYESRNLFRKEVGLDDATWVRARAWALWKALIVCAQLTGTNPKDIETSWKVLDKLINDYKGSK